MLKKMKALRFENKSKDVEKAFVFFTNKVRLCGF